VSRLCAELDRGVRTFRERRLDEQRYPYVWLDAMAENVREGGRITLMEFLVTVAVNERGDREILGCEVRSGETEAIWTAFLRSVLARALTGVRLVTSDAHVWLREAIRATLHGRHVAALSSESETMVLKSRSSNERSGADPIRRASRFRESARDRRRLRPHLRPTRVHLNGEGIGGESARERLEQRPTHRADRDESAIVPLVRHRSVDELRIDHAL
jgi:hypothetical protein